ncbi:hypothetical protein HanRHA438_Chr16g0737571 [Helianthus annuus]|nr:hypothetical protein HanIR_Chr16g0788781 [Helianthus annuus]KAJ0440631.1 hypothetical protein HanIR_Chr16g0788871 [Helianthus annuus]KAJ0833884.1 hypothetical protein HanRHA438_Chr16g0737571 [Helianthus annuus]
MCVIALLHNLFQFPLSSRGLRTVTGLNQHIGSLQKAMMEEKQVESGKMGGPEIESKQVGLGWLRTLFLMNQ